MLTPDIGVMIAGAGMWATTVRATTAMRAVFQWEDDHEQNRWDIRDLGVHGSSLAEYAFFSTTLSHTAFFRVRVMGTTRFAWSTTFGWTNDWLECEASYNAGGGLALTNQNNQNNVINTAIFANDGIGIVVAGSYGVRIAGTALEQNHAAGIHIQNGTNVTIDGNYFEQNANVGTTFTAGYTETVRADIIVNGSGTPDLMSAAFPATGVSIRNNTVNPTRQLAFVKLIAGRDVIIEGNVSSADAPGYADQVLVSAPFNIALGGVATASSQLVTLRNNRFARDIDVTNLARLVSGGRGGATWRDDRATVHNYAPLPVSAWTRLVAQSGSDTLTPSHLRYRGAQTHQLRGTVGGTSDIFGFALDLADHPELQGKTVYWGGWAMSGATQNSFWRSKSGRLPAPLVTGK